MDCSARPSITHRAEELLWVIARCDVEGVFSQRQTVLRQLQELEVRAKELAIPNLYSEVLASAPRSPS